jgi:hypothetical protein
LNLLAPLAETPIHTKHKKSLVLDDLCSDMSHQGQCQDQADLALIRKFPDIFPNFYLLPTPHLDRSCILELREFALNAIENFRWLALAIDQCTTGIEDFFMEWLTHRTILRPEIKGLDLRAYYRTSEFKADFLTFAREHPAAKDFAVHTLLDFEDAMKESTLNDDHVVPIGDLLPLGSVLRWGDLPVRKERMSPIKFSQDVQSVIDGLRFRNASGSTPGHRYYLKREVSTGIEGVNEISHWLACVLQNSNGHHSIRDVVHQFALDIEGLDDAVRDYVAVRVLEESHAKGFLEIYRPRPDA